MHVIKVRTYVYVHLVFLIFAHLLSHALGWPGNTRHEGHFWVMSQKKLRDRSNILCNVWWKFCEKDDDDKEISFSKTEADFQHRNWLESLQLKQNSNAKLEYLPFLRNGLKYSSSSRNRRIFKHKQPTSKHISFNLVTNSSQTENLYQKFTPSLILKKKRKNIVNYFNNHFHTQQDKKHFMNDKGSHPSSWNLTESRNFCCKGTLRTSLTNSEKKRHQQNNSTDNYASFDKLNTNKPFLYSSNSAHNFRSLLGFEVKDSAPISNTKFSVKYGIISTNKENKLSREKQLSEKIKEQNNLELNIFKDFPVLNSTTDLIVTNEKNHTTKQTNITQFISPSSRSIKHNKILTVNPDAHDQKLINETSKLNVSVTRYKKEYSDHSNLMNVNSFANGNMKLKVINETRESLLRSSIHPAFRNVVNSVMNDSMATENFSEIQPNLPSTRVEELNTSISKNNLTFDDLFLTLNEYIISPNETVRNFNSFQESNVNQSVTYSRIRTSPPINNSSNYELSDFESPERRINSKYKNINAHLETNKKLTQSIRSLETYSSTTSSEFLSSPYISPEINFDVNSTYLHANGTGETDYRVWEQVATKYGIESFNMSQNSYNHDGFQSKTVSPINSNKFYNTDINTTYVINESQSSKFPKPFESFPESQTTNSVYSSKTGFSRDFLQTTLYANGDRNFDVKTTLNSSEESTVDLTPNKEFVNTKTKNNLFNEEVTESKLIQSGETIIEKLIARNSSTHTRPIHTKKKSFQHPVINENSATPFSITTISLHSLNSTIDEHTKSMPSNLNNVNEFINSLESKILSKENNPEDELEKNAVTQLNTSENVNEDGISTSTKNVVNKNEKANARRGYSFSNSTTEQLNFKTIPEIKEVISSSGTTISSEAFSFQNNAEGEYINTKSVTPITATTLDKKITVFNRPKDKNTTVESYSDTNFDEYEIIPSILIETNNILTNEVDTTTNFNEYEISSRFLVEANSTTKNEVGATENFNEYETLPFILDEVNKTKTNEIGTTINFNEYENSSSILIEANNPEINKAGTTSGFKEYETSSPTPIEENQTTMNEVETTTNFNKHESSSSILTKANNNVTYEEKSNVPEKFMNQFPSNTSFIQSKEKVNSSLFLKWNVTKMSLNKNMSPNNTERKYFTQPILFLESNYTFTDNTDSADVWTSTLYPEVNQTDKHYNVRLQRPFSVKSKKLNQTNTNFIKYEKGDFSSWPQYRENNTEEVVTAQMLSNRTFMDNTKSNLKWINKTDPISMFHPHTSVSSVTEKDSLTEAFQLNSFNDINKDNISLKGNMFDLETLIYSQTLTPKIKSNQKNNTYNRNIDYTQETSDKKDSVPINTNDVSTSFNLVPSDKYHIPYIDKISSISNFDAESSKKIEKNTDKNFDEKEYLSTKESDMLTPSSDIYTTPYFNKKWSSDGEGTVLLIRTERDTSKTTLDNSYGSQSFDKSDSQPESTDFKILSPNKKSTESTFFNEVSKDAKVSLAELAKEHLDDKNVFNETKSISPTNVPIISNIGNDSNQNYNLNIREKVTNHRGVPTITKIYDNEVNIGTNSNLQDESDQIPYQNKRFNTANPSINSLQNKEYTDSKSLSSLPNIYNVTKHEEHSKVSVNLPSDLKTKNVFPPTEETKSVSSENTQGSSLSLDKLDNDDKASRNIDFNSESPIDFPLKHPVINLETTQNTQINNEILMKSTTPKERQTYLSTREMQIIDEHVINDKWFQEKSRIDTTKETALNKEAPTTSQSLIGSSINILNKFDASTKYYLDLPNVGGSVNEVTQPELITHRINLSSPVTVTNTRLEEDTQSFNEDTIKSFNTEKSSTEKSKFIPELLDDVFDATERKDSSMEFPVIENPLNNSNINLQNQNISSEIDISFDSRNQFQFQNTEMNLITDKITRDIHIDNSLYNSISSEDNQPILTVREIHQSTENILKPITGNKIDIEPSIISNESNSASELVRTEREIYPSTEEMLTLTTHGKVDTSSSMLSDESDLANELARTDRETHPSTEDMLTLTTQGKINIESEIPSDESDSVNELMRTDREIPPSTENMLTITTRRKVSIESSIPSDESISSNVLARTEREIHPSTKEMLKLTTHGKVDISSSLLSDESVLANELTRTDREIHPSTEDMLTLTTHGKINIESAIPSDESDSVNELMRTDREIPPSTENMLTLTTRRKVSIESSIPSDESISSNELVRTEREIHPSTKEMLKLTTQGKVDISSSMLLDESVLANELAPTDREIHPSTEDMLTLTTHGKINIESAIPSDESDSVNELMRTDREIPPSTENMLTLTTRRKVSIESSITSDESISSNELVRTEREVHPSTEDMLTLTTHGKVNIESTIPSDESDSENKLVRTEREVHPSTEDMLTLTTHGKVNIESTIPSDESDSENKLVRTEREVHPSTEGILTLTTHGKVNIESTIPSDESDSANELVRTEREVHPSTEDMLTLTTHGKVNIESTIPSDESDSANELVRTEREVHPSTEDMLTLTTHGKVNIESTIPSDESDSENKLVRTEREVHPSTEGILTLTTHGKVNIESTIPSDESDIANELVRTEREIHPSTEAIFKLFTPRKIDISSIFSDEVDLSNEVIHTKSEIHPSTEEILTPITRGKVEIESSVFSDESNSANELVRTEREIQPSTEEILTPFTDEKVVIEPSILSEESETSIKNTNFIDKTVASNRSISDDDRSRFPLTEKSNVTFESKLGSTFSSSTEFHSNTHENNIGTDSKDHIPTKVTDFDDNQYFSTSNQEITNLIRTERETKPSEEKDQTKIFTSNDNKYDSPNLELDSSNNPSVDEVTNYVSQSSQSSISGINPIINKVLNASETNYNLNIGGGIDINVKDVSLTTLTEFHTEDHEVSPTFNENVLVHASTDEGITFSERTTDMGDVYKNMEITSTAKTQKETAMQEDNSLETDLKEKLHQETSTTFDKNTLNPVLETSSNSVFNYINKNNPENISFAHTEEVSNNFTSTTTNVTNVFPTSVYLSTGNEEYDEEGQAVGKTEVMTKTTEKEISKNSFSSSDDTESFNGISTESHKQWTNSDDSSSSTSTMTTTESTIIPFHFKIDANYDEVVGPKKKQFEDSLAKQLVVAMRIPYECVQNLQVSKGSIKVDFDLVPSSDHGHMGDEKALKAAADELKRMIDSGQLNINDLNGNSLVVIPLEPPTNPPPANEMEHTTLILGVIIGAFILTVIVVAITAIIVKRKTSGNHRLSPIEEARSKQPNYREIPFQEALFMKATVNDKLMLGKYCYNTGKWVGPGPEPRPFMAPDSVVYRPPTDSEIRQTPRPPTAVRERLKNDWELDWDSMVFSR